LPEEIYEVEIGVANVVRQGDDVTVVASSFMVQESIKAADMLGKEGINIEVVDLRTVKPLDENLILASVQKTGRLVVADGGWRTCGLATEVSALVSEKAFGDLKAPVVRITLPDCPAPASAVLENAYYRTSADIIRAVKSII